VRKIKRGESDMKNKLMFGAVGRDYDEVPDFYEQKPAAAAAARAYLKCLRAAEMADWEMTGGDYVLPAFAVNSFHYGGPARRQDAQSQETFETFHEHESVAFLQSPPTALDYSEEK
jgi:hypothetical protein